LETLQVKMDIERLEQAIENGNVDELLSLCENLQLHDQIRAATACQNRKSHSMCLQLLDQLSNVGAFFEQVCCLRGDAQYDLGQFQESIDTYTSLLNFKPSSIGANNRAMAYRALGEHEKALQDFLISIRLDSTNTVAMAGVGDSYVSLGNFAKAVEVYDQILEISPLDVSALTSKSIALFNLKRWIESYEVLLTAKTIDPLSERINDLLKSFEKEFDLQ
jgi:tetratricopeptide (TPR) repeat protein